MALTFVVNIPEHRAVVAVLCARCITILYLILNILGH